MTLETPPTSVRMSGPCLQVLTQVYRPVILSLLLPTSKSQSTQLVHGCMRGDVNKCLFTPARVMTDHRNHALQVERGEPELTGIMVAWVTGDSGSCGVK